jgi:ZIP family zinc transporter
MQRCLSFGVGCGLYVVLSKIAFPEPEEILGFNEIDSESQQSQLVREAELDISGHCELDAVPSAFARTIKKRARIQLTVSGLNSIDDDDNPLSKSLKEGNTTRLSQFSRYTSGADLQSAEARRAWRVAMLLFVSIAVHNFPEGLAVAASSIHSPRLGVTTTVAIALHNIPEGIAIAIPCLAARPDLPWLAFWLATLSGLAEPLGAAVALIALHEVKEVRNDPSYISMNNVLAFVAGIMIMVAILELFPEANRHCQEGRHPLIAGSMLGTIIMLGSDMYLDSR